MNFRQIWRSILGKPKPIEPVLFDDVEPASRDNLDPEVEKEVEKGGLAILRELHLARAAVTEIQEHIAAGALAKVTGKPNAQTTHRHS